MNTVIIACEVLRPEMELLAQNMPEPPAMLFLEQKLHDYPDKLRDTFQEHVNTFENQYQGPLTILCGYGLCGRALCGVRSSRATLVFPRLHDCIPLLLGSMRQDANASSRESATYWITPGWLTSFLIPFHLEAHQRFALYEKKFGPAKAARMVKAEDALLVNYKNACHIRWAEMGDTYVADAREVANATALPYSETVGSSGYLAELLHGGNDLEKFLRLAPGQTIDMNTDGAIISLQL